MSDCQGRSVRKIAILGGSFDPVHTGHLAVADLVYSNIDLDELRLMPCKIAPHKAGFYCSDTHRMAMLRLAIQSRPYKVDCYELEQEAVSYSVRSMTALRKAMGERASLMFVIGLDSLNNLPTWKDWHDLFDLVNLVVVGRPGYDSELSSELANIVKEKKCSVEELADTANGKIVILNSSDKAISSSELRAEIANAKQGLSMSTVNQLGKPVADYIQKHGLYRA